MFTMLDVQRIITVFLLFSVGATYAGKASLSVAITSYEPKTSVVYRGDDVRLSCEASDNVDGAPDITWHLDNIVAPIIVNSSTIKITSTMEGNRTFGLLVSSNFTTPDRDFHIFCKASIGGSSKHINHPFSYKKERPRIQVTMPRTQTLVEGTRRHVLVCRVSSNDNVKSATVRWIYANTTLKEEMIKLERDKPVSRSLLLQCLTEADLGDYMCVVDVTLYEEMWHDSAVTRLKGNLPPGNSGSSTTPRVVQLLCWTFILLGNIHF